MVEAIPTWRFIYSRRKRCHLQYFIVPTLRRISK